MWDFIYTCIPNRLLLGLLVMRKKIYIYIYILILYLFLRKEKFLKLNLDQSCNRKRRQGMVVEYFNQFQSFFNCLMKQIVSCAYIRSLFYLEIHKLSYPRTCYELFIHVLIDLYT